MSNTIDAPNSGQRPGRPLPPPLPANINDWVRYLKTERNLNDLVEDIHCVLVENESYRRYLRAVWDEQAIEGSLAADNMMAATLIRNKAKADGSEVGEEKLASIVKALGTVLRRYHVSRKQRRNMVAGQDVPNDNGGE